jgi:hypothetical protein
MPEVSQFDELVDIIELKRLYLASKCGNSYNRLIMRNAYYNQLAVCKKLGFVEKSYSGVGGLMDLTV